MSMPTRDVSLTHAPRHPGDEKTREARLAIERREFARAIELLGRDGAQAGAAGAQADDAETQALLGIAHFQLEQYDHAARHYAAALRAAPAGADASGWREMLALAEANATARVNEHVPEFGYFARETLLAPPLIPAGALPQRAAERRRCRAAARACQALGDSLGVVATVAVNGDESLRVVRRLP